MPKNKWTPEEEKMIDALEKEFYEKLKNGEYDENLDYAAACYH